MLHSTSTRPWRRTSSNILPWFSPRPQPLLGFRRSRGRVITRGVLRILSALARCVGVCDGLDASSMASPDSCYRARPVCVCTQHSQHHTPPHSSLFCLVPVWLCLPRCQAAITPTTFLEDAPRPPRHSHPSWHKVAHTVPLAYGTRRLRWSGEEYGCWRVLVLVYLFTVQLGPKALTNAMAPASPRRQGTRSLQFSLQVQQPVSRTCCRQAAQVSANYVSRQRTAGNALVLTEP